MTKLQELRDRRGLTQVQLAEKAGMSVRSYQHYEAGKRKPSYKNLKALAKVLRVPMDQLF